MRGLIVLTVLVGIVILVVIIYSVHKFNQAAWRNAVNDAKWEDFSVTRNGKTDVGVRLVATWGKKTRFIQEEVIHQVPVDDPEWMIKVQEKQFEMINHANVLNDQ